MDGENDGGAAKGQAAEKDAGQRAQQPQGHEDAQADGAQAVTGTGDANAKQAAHDDYEAALKAKDAEIAELSAKVAQAAKTAEATEALNAQIAALKQQMADERVEFELRAAGARSVKAARALLGDYGGDAAALKEACPWLFDQAGGTSQNGSQNSPGLHGASGLEPAGAAGGSAERYLKRWERIAGLTDEGKE